MYKLLDLEVSGSIADWGGAHPADIGAVCHSVADAFECALREAAIEPIVVEPSYAGVPWIAHERNTDGKIRILLAARGRLWARCAYQFAHELCHALSNFHERRERETAWFEESLCETASLHALRFMSSRWRSDAPYPNWSGYSSALGDYAADRLKQHAARLPPTTIFEDWLRDQLAHMQQDSLRREDNGVVAAHLLPVFDRSPDSWRAVRYLNRAGAPASYAKLFEDWIRVAPIDTHGTIVAVREVLSLDCF